MKTLWGIDLGGTKIEGVVLNPDVPSKSLCRLRIDTQAQGGYAHILERIALLAQQMSAQMDGERPKIIGMGTPGTIDPTSGKLKNSNTVCLNGEPLKADIEQRLGISVRMANDANCFALAEARLGAAKPESPTDEHVVFGVIMGTGVGGGLVVNGRVIAGCQGIAGEWGHNVIDPEGEKCYCGKIGCVETVISGPALEKFYKNLSGESRSLKEISERAASGNDSFAEKTLTRLTSYFGKAIAAVINILDPHVIVLGGGVGNIELLYTQGMLQAREHVFNNRFETKIVRPMLGDSAGVFGAAMLCENF